MKNIMLIHTDIDLNIINNLTIWICNIFNFYIKNGNNIIYISNNKITNNEYLKNINNVSKLNIINPNKKLNPIEILKIIEKFGSDVNNIILRNNLILNIINKNWKFLNKTIIYTSDNNLYNIKKLDNKFKRILTTSEKINKLLENNGIKNIFFIPDILEKKYLFSEKLEKEKLEKEKLEKEKLEKEKLEKEKLRKVQLEKLKELNNKNNFINFTNKIFLINTNSNINTTAGDTIMISNIMNILMDNGNKIIFLTKYAPTNIFTRNLIKKNYIIINTDTNEKLIKKIDELEKNVDIIFIRNSEILNNLINKQYLSKTILYGLDVHIEGINNLNNKFLSVITQSEKLKQKYIDKGININLIKIIPPLVYKYNFDLPKRTDEQIRLIYCGSLRDQENILEIINEFQKINKKYPKVVLKIIYGKIAGDNKLFKKKIIKYIRNGVNGITFKYNLNHRDACYEIATSDIGICWRKNGWGDNGEISTKMKEYESYNLPCLFFFPHYNNNIYNFLLELKKKDPYILSFYKQIYNIYNEKIKFIPYVLHNGLPYDNGGYSIRSHSIMNVFNKMYSDKQYIAVHKYTYPYVIFKINNVKKYVNKIDNVYYITLPFKNDLNYNRILVFLTGLFNFKTFHVASSYSNARPIIDFCSRNNLKSIYEVRGMWQLTAISKGLHYQKYSKSKEIKEMYNIKKYKDTLSQEIDCIKKASKTFYITDELYNYSKKYINNLNITDNWKIENLLATNNISEPIFYNCSNFNYNLNIIEKEKNNDSLFIIGYSGSIVYYEGIYEAIISIEKLINDTKLNIEVHILGNIKTIIDEENNLNLSMYKTLKNKPFVKLIDKVSHDKVKDIIMSFDLYIIPRLDLPVTNIVSPIKPFEPMSLKIPLLMSDCLCLNKIANNGKNCMQFIRNDFNDFNNKILEIIKNGYDSKLLENAYNYIKNERSWDNMIKHIDLYNIV